MNKTSLPDESKIACCLTCTLGTAMRDCKNCPFNIGLIVKGLQAIKQAEHAAHVSTFEKFDSGYLANIPTGAK